MTESLLGFPIRIVNTLKGPPYPSVVMPNIRDGSPGSNEIAEKSGATVLSIAVPPGDSHHLALGQFLDAWSRTEFMIGGLVTKLLGTDDVTPSIVQNTLGIRQIIELVSSLSALKFEASDDTALAGLMARVGAMNTKRNVLVHGHWLLEVTLSKKDGVPILKQALLRELTPTDPSERKKLNGVPKNQKARARYSFSVRRIDETTKMVHALKTDISDFLQRAKFDDVKLRKLRSD